MLYILKHNLVLKSEISIEMTIISNQCTGKQNHLFPFLMKKFKPTKIAFILSICIYFIAPPPPRPQNYLLQIYIISEMVWILKV